MRDVFVGGLGVWTTGVAGVAQWRSGARDAAVVEPRCAIIPPRLGRFTSLVTRMAAEALAQAAAQGQPDLARVVTVYGSANGEIQTALQVLDAVHAEGLPSPARFKNSVHNTAAGHVSIATGNRELSTALAAGERTFAMCLLEAFAILEERGGAVLVSVADESLPPPLDAFGVYAPLAVAFSLSAEPPPSGALGRLSSLRLAPGAATLPATMPAELAKNPCAAALPLLDALVAGRSGTAPLELSGNGWCVELASGGAA